MFNNAKKIEDFLRFLLIFQNYRYVDFNFFQRTFLGGLKYVLSIDVSEIQHKGAFLNVFTNPFVFFTIHR